MAGFLSLSVITMAQDGTVKVLSSDQAMAKDSLAIPAKAQEKFNQGVTAFEQTLYAESVVAFSEAITLAPGFAKAYLNRGFANLELKKTADAKADFVKATSIDKSLHQAFFELGILAETEKNLPEAIGFYGQAIAANPAESKYLYQRALLYFAGKEYESAKKDLTSAIDVKKDFAFALNDRGSVNRELGDLAAAIKDYKAATEADPKLTIAFNNLGSAYRKKGEFDNAIKAYDDAVKSDPKFYLAYNNRGFAKFEKGDFEGAIKDFNEAIKIKSDYAYAYNNLAGAYLKLKKYQEAINACDKAILLDAEYGYAYYNRGVAYEMLRDLNKACQDWGKAADLGIESARKYFQNSDCNNL